MELNFKRIDEKNRCEVCTLKIADKQKGFIETIEQCLQEANQDDRWFPVAIYDDTLIIGFAMYGFFDEYLPEGRLWMDRLLIDIKYQGHGYGKLAMQQLIALLNKQYPSKDIYLSVVADNAVATKLYKSLGFHFINEKDIHDEDVMVRKTI